MDIPKINALPTAIKMRREVVKLAIEKNVSEDDIWWQLEIYKKANSIKAKPIPCIKDILSCIIGVDKIRITDSPIEDALKYELQGRQIEFEAQKEIGKYRVDFYFAKAKLVVECDGKEYHSDFIQQEKDIKREFEIMKKGYIVLRFKGSEIYQDVIGCVDKIEELLSEWY